MRMNLVCNMKLLVRKAEELYRMDPIYNDCYVCIITNNNMLNTSFKKKIIQLDLTNTHISNAYHEIQAICEDSQPTPEATLAIKFLWQTQAIQSVWKKRNKFHVYDSAEYFFNNIDRIMDSNYQPTDRVCN